MLCGINPLLGPDLLFSLAAMGHGDKIAIVDANYPAHSAGPKCIRLDGINATDVLTAVLGVMPLDNYVATPVNVMQVVGDTTVTPPIVEEFQQIVDHEADNPAQITGLERFEFYRHVNQAFVVVQTGERRLYGNILLTKGVVLSP